MTYNIPTYPNTLPLDTCLTQQDKKNEQMTLIPKCLILPSVDHIKYF